MRSDAVGSSKSWSWATLSLVTERRVSQPWRLARGGLARWARTGCGLAATNRAPLPDKVTARLVEGDAVQPLTPGGGGWGTP